MHTKTSRKIITLALALILALGIFANTVLAAYTASEWAKPELEKAQSYGLIPDVLKDADLTKPITRAEFAAVAVKAYENFTGTSVTPVASNPFTDTSNTDVLKAYNINIVNGTSATTYGPNGILTRQDAATMLTRVEKKAYIPGWTLASDNTYTLNFTQPARFADDGNISGYAKASVYFMNVKGVINGTGNNNFSPTVTATRQEALIIAARMVDNLKGKALDYTQGATPQPTPPPSGGLNADEQDLVGRWAGAFSGVGYYYEFRDDGTFSLYRTMSSNNHANVKTSNTTYLNVGHWSYSGATVYMTQQKVVEWSVMGAGTEIPTNPVWREIGDESMRIKRYDDEFEFNGEVLKVRFFRNFEIFDESILNNPYITDKDVAYLRLDNKDFPSWVWLGY